MLFLIFLFLASPIEGRAEAQEHVHPRARIFTRTTKTGPQWPLCVCDRDIGLAIVQAC